MPVSSVSQSCLTLCELTDCSLPGSSMGISQAKKLEWAAISFSRGSSRPRDWTHVSCTSCLGRQVLCHWASWEAPQEAHIHGHCRPTFPFTVSLGGMYIITMFTVRLKSGDRGQVCDCPKISQLARGWAGPGPLRSLPWGTVLLGRCGRRGLEEWLTLLLGGLLGEAAVGQPAQTDEGMQEWWRPQGRTCLPPLAASTPHPNHPYWQATFLPIELTLLKFKPLASHFLLDVGKEQLVAIFCV